LFIIFFLFFLSTELKANDISVKNVRLTEQENDSHTMINFDLSWKNSWRNSTNWDAAWLFVKYRIGNGDWFHSTLSVNVGEHTVPAESTISPSSDGKGAFIYRSSDGIGENDYNISLRWNYPSDGVANDAQLTVKVFAIEMVYIPQSGFSLGDGFSPSTFHIAGDPSTPFTVSSENSIIINETSQSSLWATGNLEIGSGQIPAEFPKGYKAFYLMKYEITQGQYAEFLNMLSPAQVQNRFNPSITENRYTITGSYPLLTSNRPSRACNFLAYIDGAAYADWASLRPISEFEFEKACRGTASPVPGEKAWGNNQIFIDGDLSGLEDGSETVTGLNVNADSILFINGDGGYGPIRSGIFAATINTRQGSGGTFYGVMEMSGNVFECVVSAGLEVARSFQGSHGDGVLSLIGFANNSDWPGYQSGQVISNEGSGSRGGAWNVSEGNLSVSQRLYSNSSSFRDKSNGMRCGRTVE
jgi:formylglycine-generating enzyme required for sulfatase activity